MLTWPRPGIQIGSCMRSTPGATSVTSSDAGSCSCRGGRARGWVSVMAAGYPAPSETVSSVQLPVQLYASGASFGHGRLASATAPHARTTSSSSRRPTTCRPTGRPSDAHPTGMLTPGIPEMLNGAV